MGDIDTLRPEVREALDEIDDCMRMDIKVVPVGALGVLSAELLRLADENARLLAASRDAMDHFEQMKAELATLKARIADAPMAVVQSAPGAIKTSFHGYGCFEYTAENLQPKLRGKRVLLVVEE